MKSIKEIKKEIGEIKGRLETEALKKMERSRLMNKMQLLKDCILYLESNPSEHFLHEEKERLENKLTIIYKRFDATAYQNLVLSEFNKIKKEHEKLYDVPRIKSHLKNIKYITGQSA